MGCKDTVLPNPLFTNHSVKCLTFEENTRKPYNDNLCLFRALVLHLQGNQRLEEETSKLFDLFIEKTSGTDPTNFQGYCMEYIAAVEDIAQEDIFLYDIDIGDGSMIGELAGRSVRKHSNTVRILRWTSHLCYVSNINALFQAYRCVQFVKRAYNL